MQRPPDIYIKGTITTIITCRGCARRVERENIGNELVGRQDRLRCSSCGHRGADLIRAWSPNEKKAPDPKARRN